MIPKFALGNAGLAPLALGGVYASDPAPYWSRPVLGAVAWIAGCGGGGEQRKPTRRGRARRRGAGRRARTTGGAATGPAERRGDAGIDAPGKPMGSSCAMAAECASGFCADGVCCNSACTGVCLTCAARERRDLRRAQLGTDPRNECPVEAASTCGTTASATAPAPATSTRPARSARSRLHRVDADVGVPLRRHRHLRADAGPVVRAVHLRDRRPLPHHLHQRRRLRGAQQLPQRQLRQEAARRHLRQRRRVQLRLLRAGGLLRRPPAPGTCRSCAVAGSVGTCTNVPAGERSAGPVRRPGRPELRHRRHVRRQGGLPAVRVGDAAASRRACAGSTATLAGRCDGAGVCAPGAQQPCEPYVCGTAGRAGRRARPTPTARTATSATGRSAARRSTASTARPAPSARRGSCQQGVCCAGACTGTCTSCALAGTRGVCTADPGRHRPAEPVRGRRRRRAAAPTGPATAPAPAACTRPATPAAARPAPARR